MVLSMLCGFSIQNKKTQWPTTQPCKSFGYVSDFRVPVPEIYFSTQKMEALRALSRAVVARTRAARASGGVYLVSVGLLQHVVGTWTWAMLIMRELLSIFARTYRYTESFKAKTRQLLWPCRQLCVTS